MPSAAFKIFGASTIGCMLWKIGGSTLTNSSCLEYTVLKLSSALITLVFLLIPESLAYPAPRAATKSHACAVQNHRSSFPSSVIVFQAAS